MPRFLSVLIAAVLLTGATTGMAVAQGKDQLYNCTNGTDERNGVSKKEAVGLKSEGYACWGQEEKRKYKYFCTGGGQSFYTIRELVKLNEAQGYTCKRQDMPPQS
jgi:hypothetical protein